MSVTTVPEVVVHSTLDGNLSPRIRGGTVVGPVSYPTGGFTLDLGGFAAVSFFTIALVSRHTSAVYHEAVLDSPAAGQVKIKVYRFQFDKLTGITNATNPQGGATVRTASGATVNNESAHVHSVDHNHAAVTSGTPSSATGAVLVAVSGNITLHTHSFDLPALGGGNTGTVSHGHVFNSIYQHKHAFGVTATSIARAEVANATDLSSSTWRWIAAGV